MRKILFISTHYPSRLGGVRRLYYNLVEFSRLFEVHYVWVNLGTELPKASMGLPKNVRFSEVKPSGLRFDPGALLLLPNAWLPAWKMGASEQFIQNYIDKNRIDAVVIHALDSCVALRKIKAKAKVAEVLDSVHAYYVSKNKSSISPLSFILGIEQFFAEWMRDRLLAGSYSLAVYVSKAEAAESGIPKGKTITVEAHAPPVAAMNTGARKYGAVIFGRFMHPPNRDGLMRVLPSLAKINGKVLIIGPGLKKRIKFPPNVEVAGFVDDIDSLLSNAKVCIIPVWYGAGLQNKVFDALRHGCTVVSTTFTKKTFEENGFFSGAIICSNDIVSATNKVLSGWSPAHAKRAYSAYSKFYGKCSADEKAYVERVGRLLEGKEKPHFSP